MKLATLLILMTVTTAVFGKGHKTSHSFVHVLSSRMNIVHVKIDREVAGATLEIYTENGELIKKEELTERKILIDFSGQREGIYKIKLRHNGQEEVLNYINTSSFVPAPGEEIEPITIIQGI